MIKTKWFPPDGDLQGVIIPTQPPRKLIFYQA